MFSAQGKPNARESTESCCHDWHCEHRWWYEHAVDVHMMCSEKNPCSYSFKWFNNRSSLIYMHFYIYISYILYRYICSAGGAAMFSSCWTTWKPRMSTACRWIGPGLGNRKKCFFFFFFRCCSWDFTPNSLVADWGFNGFNHRNSVVWLSCFFWGFQLRIKNQLPFSCMEP